MMIIGRGVAGVGAGGEYSVCTSQALECADSNPQLQRRRGMLVAVSTNAAIISGFVGSSIVSLIVLRAYNGQPSDGVWRICFGIGIFVSPVSLVGASSDQISSLSLSFSSACGWQTLTSIKSTPFGGTSPTSSP